MKIFVAGATGALGRVLVPQLVAGGHEVVGMTRTASKQDLVRGLGARPAVADALDPDAVARVVAEAEPEVIVHQLTALSGTIDMRHMDRSFAETNRLRTEGTDHLLAAGRAVGVRRFVAQSFAGWPSERTGGPVKREADPLDPSPPAALRPLVDALRHLEEAVTGAAWTEGIVLRYGGFYGPGTSLSLEPEGEHVAAIRRRKFPVVGSGAGMWSFIHIEDAATATVAAIERGERGIYNVVDDEPAPVSVWLPVAADAFGAKPPRRVPRWLGRIMAGEAATVMMTEARGASNEKAKRELGWSPRYASWRQGFTEGTRHPAHSAGPSASEPPNPARSAEPSASGLV
ncbi:MAG TPA: NAD(P)-dependent oxidoreductase [Thermoleophilaceae bacterium]|nr:NAD(P)-dependent oxidoreductase [Thermoleophilaceae bacterium]